MSGAAVTWRPDMALRLPPNPRPLDFDRSAIVWRPKYSLRVPPGLGSRPSEAAFKDGVANHLNMVGERDELSVPEADLDCDAFLGVEKFDHDDGDAGKHPVAKINLFAGPYLDRVHVVSPVVATTVARPPREGESA